MSNVTDKSSSTGRTAPKPPKHLSRNSAAWWRQVVEEWELDNHHLKLLQLACEAFDRAQMAREDIQKNGSLVVISASGTLKPHPSISIERDSRLAFARLLRELDLDRVDPGNLRPPSIPSNRRR